MKELYIFRLETFFKNLQGDFNTKQGRPYILLKVDDKNVYLLQCYSVKEKQRIWLEKNKGNNKIDRTRFYILGNDLFSLKTLNRDTYILMNQILIINKNKLSLSNSLDLESIPNILSKEIWDWVFNYYKYNPSFALISEKNSQLIHCWTSKIYYYQFEKNNWDKREEFVNFIKKNNIRIDLTYEIVDELLDCEFSKISIGRKYKEYLPDKSGENEKMFIESLTETELKIYMSGRNGFGDSGSPSGSSMRLKSEFEENDKKDNKKEEEKDEKEKDDDERDER